VEKKLIKLINVQKIYPPDQVALQGMTFRARPGDFVFVAGASGAGKSTLLKLLFAAERITSGQIVIGGRNLASVDDSAIAYFRREVGVVFQDYKLLPRRSVLDNVTFALEVQSIGREERREVGLRMLESLGLKHKAESSPLTLSGGEQQRVAIGRALIHRPKLILADEPTGNLDPDMARLVFDLLLEANKTGVTVIVATHNLSLIEELNLRTIVLDQGKVIGDFESPRGLG